MDFGEIGQNVVPLVLLAVFLIASIFLRKRKGERTTLEVISSLLSEITYNQKLMETFLLHWQAKKFRTGSWQRNKARLDFLSHLLQATLAEAFNIAEDFNQQIDAAKKHKSSSYLANINVERLRTPLAKSKQGLEEWLQSNLRQKGG